MTTQFHKLQSAKLDDVKAEAVRRDHARAIAELQNYMRTELSLPRSVGFAHYTRTGSNQTNLSVNDTIEFDTEELNLIPKLVKFSSSGSVFNLAPDYVYRLSASLLMFDTGDALAASWYDADSAAAIGTPGYFQAVNKSDIYSDQPTPVAVLKPTRWRRVLLRATAVGTSPSVSATYQWGTIEVFRP